MASDPAAAVRERLVELAGALRRGGVRVGTGEVEAAARALAAVDAASRTDSRLALRAVLCSRREDLPERSYVVHHSERGLTVRFGAELTYRRRYEEDVRRHLRRHRYDYTIGSVHADPDSPYAPDRVGTWVVLRSRAVPPRALGAQDNEGDDKPC